MAGPLRSDSILNTNSEVDDTVYRQMKIAIEGCCHGELDKIYETIAYIEEQDNIKIDLLLICGDFQAVRNKSDLCCMAVPKKYQKMNTFYKYYSGEKKTPVLTVVIGGNHEASNYLQELPYGGWLAPDIYYMGYANVLKFGDVRIGGLSGIYKSKDFHRGHFEHPPYSEDSMRSAYHVRSLEVFRMKQISKPIDIFLSHDWPTGIHEFGNVDQLLKKKPFFREDIAEGKLGSLACEELLYLLKPEYWFAAHLHVKFAALVEHRAENGQSKMTKFLSLDKCLPRRKFLQVIDVPGDSDTAKLQLDAEWLCILKSTNHLLSLSKGSRYMPGPGSNERHNFKVTEEDVNSLLEDFGGDLTIPENFEKTVPAFNPNSSFTDSPPTTMINPQTTLICTMLELTDPNAVFCGKDSSYKLDSSILDSSNIDDNDDSLDTSRVSFHNYSTFIETDTESELDDSQKNSSLNPEDIFADESSDQEELNDILEAQKSFNLDDSVGQVDVHELSTHGLGTSSSRPVTGVPLNQSLDIEDDEDELQAVLLAQKTHQQSTPYSTPQHGTEGGGDLGSSTDNSILGSSASDEPLAERLSKRHDDSSLLEEESPKTKKLKRRNVSIYAEENSEVN